MNNNEKLESSEQTNNEFHQLIFSPAFQDRMKFLEDFRKRKGIRDYSKNPSTFSLKERKEQEIRHWMSKNNIELSEKEIEAMINSRSEDKAKETDTKSAFKLNRMKPTSPQQKAVSLSINSVGQRPTINSVEQRPTINSVGHRPTEQSQSN
jgi:HD superfamily phosphohydrolase